VRQAADGRRPSADRHPAALLGQAHHPRPQAEFKAAGHKSEPVKKAEAELDKLRGEPARVRKEKRQLSELVGTYVVMIEQLASKRAEVQAGRG
jgi:hypothetical protein